jgi:signal peptidase I
MVVLARPRRFLPWLLAHLFAQAGVVLSVKAGSRLLIPAFVLLFLTVLGGLIDTWRVRPGPFPGWSKTWLLAVALLVGERGMLLAVRARGAEALQVPAGSMLPTLAQGDHIYVDKGARAPARGDVIVFQYPLDAKVDYIKRVIGLPGETVEIVDHRVLIDGKPLPVRPLAESVVCSDQEKPDCAVWEETAGAHPYRVAHWPGGQASRSFGPKQVPAGELFFLGDNRENSNDSRVWGTVPLALVKGRATMLWYSAGPDGIHWERIGKRIE